jgi:protein TonB
MTQRTHLHTADLPLHGADAFAAAGTGPGASGGSLESNARSATSTNRQRKAARIAVSLPIMVHDQFGGHYQVRTQFVTMRGAVLITTSSVRIGHRLTIQNLRSGKSAECHVISLERAVKEGHEVEVEFTRPQPDFWPVQFPTDDSRSQETVSSSSFAGNAIEPQTTKAEPDLSGSIVAFSEPVSPKTHHDDGLVVLADSVAADFSPPPTSRSQETFTPRPAPVDSVAQFRAANRAAHRREQAMKTFYSVLSLIALAGLAFAGRGWISHPSEITARLSAVMPKAKAAAQAPNETTASAGLLPAPRSFPKEVRETSSFTQHQSNAVATAEPAVAPEHAYRSSNSQVAVRHGSSVASSHKQPVQETEEEPIALPLDAGNAGSSATKPELLNSVVGQAPIKTAVLAPPPTPVPSTPALPRQVTPAKLVYSSPAQYPSIARQLHTEGEVVINVDVDTSGTVSAAKAVSGPSVLRTAALDAVKRWKYAPATLDGKPVASTQTVKVDFRLK